MLQAFKRKLGPAKVLRAGVNLQLLARTRQAGNKGFKALKVGRNQGKQIAWLRKGVMPDAHTLAVVFVLLH